MTNFDKLILITFAAAGIMCLCSACTKTPPPRYMPSENFDRQGNSCGTINCGKQWLKPCSN